VLGETAKARLEIELWSFNLPIPVRDKQAAHPSHRARVGLQRGLLEPLRTKRVETQTSH